MGTAAINERGQRYGHLVVLERADRPDHVKDKWAYWLCACDCGEKTIIQGYRLRSGRTKSCGCSKRQTAEKHHNWKGGRHRGGQGYMVVYIPESHSMASMRMRYGYVLEHRLVMAESLGRPLESWESVHHINGDRTDNRLENLELWHGKHPSGSRLKENPHCPTCTCKTKPTNPWRRGRRFGILERW